jgi:hypothetical protein
VAQSRKGLLSRPPPSPASSTRVSSRCWCGPHRHLPTRRPPNYLENEYSTTGGTKQRCRLAHRQQVRQVLDVQDRFRHFRRRPSEPAVGGAASCRLRDEVGQTTCQEQLSRAIDLAGTVATEVVADLRCPEAIIVGLSSPARDHFESPDGSRTMAACRDRSGLQRA